jgi:hypothetical protein
MIKSHYFTAFVCHDRLCNHALAAEEVGLLDCFTVMFKILSVLAFILGTIFAALFLKKLNFQQRNLQSPFPT